MNHRILGRGAIACSAVVVAQWIPSFDIQLPGNICQRETEPDPAGAIAGSASLAQQSQKCSVNGMFALLESLPERFKLQWSQSRSSQLPHSIERQYQELVEQAQTLAGENRVAEAIVLMNAIPKNSRYFDLAYQMQETWSQEALHEATSHYQQADLATALKLLEAIPATSSQYPQVSQLKRKWQQDAAQMQRAIAASKAGAWEEVIQQLEAFKDTPLFQSLPVQELLQLAMVKLLEPDPALLQIAFAMNSTSLSAAPLPAAIPYPVSASAPAALPVAPPPSPSTPSRIDIDNINVDQVLPPAVEPSSTTKAVKPEAAQPVRQAAIPESALLMRDSTSIDVRPSRLSPSVISAVHHLRRAIAEPELILQ